jgi:hypothetical protein
VRNLSSSQDTIWIVNQSLAILTAARQRQYLLQLPTYNIGLELRQIAVPIGITFQWVLSCPEFKKWIQGRHDPVISILGKPGCGKSVLSAFIHREMSGLMPAYFACKESDDARRMPTMILSSLLHQILTDQPYLFRYAMREDQFPPSWSYDQLLESFDAVINSPDNKGIVCIVDALDECHEDYRKQFIRDLKKIFDKTLHGKNAGYARLLVTSRKNYHDIDTLATIRLDLDLSPETKEDMRVFIEERVKALINFRPEYGRLQSSLIEKLQGRANGMYQLIQLLAEDLENATDSSEEGLQEIITSVPGSIAEAYNKIWNRIPSQERYRAQRIFCWLLCALRPLSPREMATALAVEFANSSEPIKLKALNISRDIAGDLKRLFGPLIRVSYTIEVSHQTVREHFLQGLTKHLGCLAPKIIDSSEAHAFIARSCLRYLNSEDFRTTPQLWHPYYIEDFKFYTLRFMSQHVAHARTRSEIFSDQIVKFFTNETWSEKWTQNLAPISQPFYYSTWRPSIRSALSFCCQFNLPELLSSLLKAERVSHPLCRHERCAYKSFHLVYEAFIGGGEQCVSLMVRALDEVMFKTPLVCQTLLDSSSESSSDYFHPKHHSFPEHTSGCADPGSSIESISEEIEKFDEEHEPQIDLDLLSIGQSGMHQQRFERVLQKIYSRQQNHLRINRSGLGVSDIDAKIVTAYRNLAPTGTDTRILSDIESEALYNAVLLFCFYITWTYGESATELLARTSPIVFEAIKRGHFPAAKYLIQEGADVRFCDSEGTSALHWAAQIGNTELVQLLLNTKSIDVNATNDSGLTPLHYACMPCSLLETEVVLGCRPQSISRAGVVRLLLSSGANRRSRDQHGNTPFQTLARLYVPEWKEIAKYSELNWREQDLNECIDLLLEELADLIEWDRFGTTPLHYASYLWPVSAIQQLLRFLDDWSLAPTLLDHRGLTPLHYAAVRASEAPEEVVRLLAEAGVDVRVKDPFGHTALNVARQFGQSRVAEELEEIKRALEDQITNAATYQRWLASAKSPFQNGPSLSIDQSFSLLNILKPQLMQGHQARNYASFPSTEVSLLNQELFLTLTLSLKYICRFRSPKGPSLLIPYQNKATGRITIQSLQLVEVKDPVLKAILKTHDSALTAMFHFVDLNRNLDPFAGVGLIHLHRPIAPRRMQYLSILFRNSPVKEWETVLHDEIRARSPLQRKEYQDVYPDQYEVEYWWDDSHSEDVDQTYEDSSDFEEVFMEFTDQYLRHQRQKRRRRQRAIYYDWRSSLAEVIIYLLILCLACAMMIPPSLLEGYPLGKGYNCFNSGLDSSAFHRTYWGKWIYPQAWVLELPSYDKPFCYWCRS